MIEDYNDFKKSFPNDKIKKILKIEEMAKDLKTQIKKIDCEIMGCATAATV